MRSSRLFRPVIPALAAALLLTACSGSGSGDSADTLTVNGDVPLVYAMRATALGLNPTDGTNSAPGGDLRQP